MLSTERDATTLKVLYRSYLPGLLLLAFPPVLIYELGGGLLDGNLETSEQIGLALGVLMPLAGGYYLIEFACFSFSRADGRFRWRWRNLFGLKSGEVSFERIARVGREAIDASDASGTQRIYRLVVELDDDTVIPLTRGYSGLHDRKLERIVDQIREHIGHVVLPG
jgi:hypothetical protein